MKVRTKSQKVCRCGFGLFMGLCMSGTYLYAADDGLSGRNVLAVQTVQSVSQAKRYVTGVVKDTSGEPIIGATVTVKGVSGGALTDVDGKFSIQVPDNQAVIVVSFIGFNTEEIKVGARRSLIVTLREDVQSLDEVVVVGYGTQKKATLTGAISSVGTESLLKSPSASVTNSLAGQLPGISAIQASGQPGSDQAELYVRGVGSLNEADSTPLVLVDGVERDFFQMDPNEIESVTVLKDASATAVYGVRGANGVILVTTRRGEEGKAKISITSNVGVQMPTRLLKTADSYTTAMAYNEAQRNSGWAEQDLAFDAYALERFRLGDDPIMYPNVDWYDYLINKAAIQTQHNINISGGTKKVRYFISAGFLYQNGLFKQLDGLDYDNNFKYKRYNYRANLDINLSPTTVLKFNMGGTVGDQRYPNNGEGGKDIWKQLTWSYPFSSPGVVDGKKVITPSERFTGFDMGSSQVFEAMYGSGYGKKISNNMNFDLDLTQKLDFVTKGLSINVKGAYNTDYSYIHNTQGAVETYYSYYQSSVDGSGLLDINDPNFNKTVVYRLSGQNTADVVKTGKKTRGRDWYVEASVRYNRKFGDHSVGAMLLYNQSKKYYPSTYPDVPSAYVGIAGRLTYDYKQKYLAEFNVGRNGSENFAPDRRFATFPAGSLGYVVTEESWFPKNKWLTYLKLRASVGLVGNDKTARTRFMYLPSAYTVDDTGDLGGYTEKNGYVFGMYNTSRLPVAFENSMGNLDVTWETALKQNYGIDAYFFSDRFKVTVDYFREHRRDILTSRNTVPNLTAINSVLPKMNIGKVDNHGYELDVRWSDRIKDFSYYINANVSYAKNKIVYMDEVEPNEPYMRQTGQEVGARFGRVALGFYDESDFNPDGTLRADLPQPKDVTVQPGDIKYADLNGDHVIDPDDYTVIGHPKRPAYTFGLNFGFEYKGFFASTNWAGAAQTNIQMNWHLGAFYTAGTLYQYVADGYWTPERGDNAQFPRLTANKVDHNQTLSRIWLRDASYLKLKNLTVGYNITHPKVLKAIGANALSVRFTGYNLLTFDKLDVFDPEGELSRDGNTYPITKIFTIGINATF